MAPAVKPLARIADTGTISRGKRTFFTRLAFATMLDAAVWVPPKKMSTPPAR